jgi:hypothetical protein
MADELKDTLTDENEVLRRADIAAGKDPKEAKIPIPADELDRRARVEQAELSEKESREQTPAKRPAAKKSSSRKRSAAKSKA